MDPSKQQPTNTFPIEQLFQHVSWLDDAPPLKVVIR